MALRLAATGVDARYGAVRALNGASVTVEDGETVVLLGTNGNGKSTLMKCLMGIVRPTSGSIELEIEGTRHDLARLPTEEIVGLGIALVPEGRRLFPKLTVEENLMLGAFRKSARTAIAANLAFAYEAFPVLAERRRQLAGTMSGGQQQMLAIGRALMTDPVLLALDEPSLGLAPLIIDRIYEVIVRLRDEMKMTVLLVEQNAQRALDIADYAYILETGRVVLDGTAQKLAANEDVQEFYLGVSSSGRKSLRDVKHYKRRKRWLS